MTGTRLAEATAALNETVRHPRALKHDDPGIQRERPEPLDDLRTPFQADQDRIVLSKAFRRLKHKTQFMWAPRNDHFRTRLTHTIEVVHTARVVATLLGLNTDLAEAIAYGHDVGRAPFGEAGDRAMQEWADAFVRAQEEKPVDQREPDFRHGPVKVAFDPPSWARELLQEREQMPYADPDAPRGLNLTVQTATGIANPTLRATSSLEAQAVGAAHDLTWINHDYDDLRHAGLRVSPDAFDALRALGKTRNERLHWAFHSIVGASEEAGDRVELGHDLAAAVTSVVAEYQQHYANDQMWLHHEQGARTVVQSLLNFYALSDPDFIEATIRRMTGRGTRGVAGEEEISFLDSWKSGVPRAVAAVQHVAKMSDTFALDLYRHVYAPEIREYYF